MSRISPFNWSLARRKKKTTKEVQFCTVMPTWLFQRGKERNLRSRNGLNAVQFRDSDTPQFFTYFFTVIELSGASDKPYFSRVRGYYQSERARERVIWAVIIKERGDNERTPSGSRATRGNELFCTFFFFVFVFLLLSFWGEFRGVVLYSALLKTASGDITRNFVKLHFFLVPPRGDYGIYLWVNERDLIREREGLA